MSRVIITEHNIPSLLQQQGGVATLLSAAAPEAPDHWPVQADQPPGAHTVSGHHTRPPEGVPVHCLHHDQAPLHHLDI